MISLINFPSFSGQRVTKVSNRYRPISFKRLFISDIRYIWVIFFKEVPSKKQLNFIKLRFHFQHRWKIDSESQNSLFNLRRTWHKSFLWHFLLRVNLRLRAVLLSSAKSVSWFQEKNSVKKINCCQRAAPHFQSCARRADTAEPIKCFACSSLRGVTFYYYKISPSVLIGNSLGLCNAKFQRRRPTKKHKAQVFNNRKGCLLTSLFFNLHDRNS